MVNSIEDEKIQNNNKLNLNTPSERKIKYIEVEGSHFEMGKSQGEQLKKLYDKFFGEMITSDLITNVKPKFLTMNFMLKLLGWISKKKLKPILTRYAPLQHGYVLGLAQGLQIKRNIAYALNLLEILTGHPKLTMSWPKNINACTQIFALSEATNDNYDYFARNYDFPNELEDYQCVRKTKPNEGFCSIGLTQVFIAGVHHGMNEKGLAVGINYGRSWKKNVNGLPDYRVKGLPSTMLVQETLEKCSNMEEAIEFITHFSNRGNGAHYGILDKFGNACVVETTASRYAIRYPEGGILTHTNLYLTDELLDANVPKEVKWKTKHMTRPYYLSPQRRYERASELMQKMKGKLNREEMYKILSDHNNREPDDDTICTHGEVGSTLATITCIPKKLEFWVSTSPPCKSKQKLFKI
ncbi:MAG: C45 family autoproteolytic acyltransferase/hydrolase [Promethearchaeota archaeon]